MRTPAQEALEVLAQVDARSADGFLALFAENLSFTMGNLPTVAGKADLHRMLEGFFPAIGGIAHTVSAAWRDADTLIFRGDVDYERLDGSHLLVPYANILEYEGELIRDYRIYVDNSGLFQSAEE